MFSRLSHVALAVPSIEAAAARLEQVYGLRVTERHENPEQGVRMAYVDLGGETRMELIEPLHAESPLARYLERHPQGGLHHLSFATPGLDEAAEALAGSGVRPVSPPQARNVHGERIAFLHPRDFLGVLVELEERGTDHE